MKRREMRRKRERESIPPVLAALVDRVEPRDDPAAPRRSLEPFATHRPIADGTLLVLEGAGLAKLCAELGEACEGGPHDLLAIARRVPRSQSTDDCIDVTELCFAISQAIGPVNIHERRRAAGSAAMPIDESSPLVMYYRGERFATLVETSGTPVAGKEELKNNEEKVKKDVEEEWRQFLAVLAVPLPMTLRVHRSERALRHIALQFLQHDEDVRAVLRSIAPPMPNSAELFGCSHELYHSVPRVEYICRTLHAASAVSFQEVVSAIPVLVADIQPHHAVLDMCAAPGSKSLQSLDAMLQQGWGKAETARGVMIINEKNRVKATQTLPARLKRYHTPNAICTRCDAVQWPRFFRIDNKNHHGIDMSKNDNKTNANNGARTTAGTGMVGYAEWRFDRIICDVPCSGDGTLRKERTAASSWSPQYVASLVPTQKALLRRGLDLLCVGGVLVYSTCSLNPKEDEEVVCAALELFDDTVELIDVNAILRDSGAVLHSIGGLLAPNTDELQRGVLPSTYDGRKVLRVLPHRDDTGGFFVAAFRKRAMPPDYTPPTALREKLNQWTKAKLWAPVRRDDEVWRCIAEFYDFDRNNTDVFQYHTLGKPWDTAQERCGLVPVYHLNPNGGPCRRIVLATPATAHALFEARPYKGPGVEIVSVGVRAFEAYDGKFLADAPCRWRAVVEAASHLAPAMRRRKMILSAITHPNVLKELLTNGFVSLRDYWRLILRQASPEGETAFARPGPLHDILVAKEWTEPTADELHALLTAGVDVGGVLLGLVGGRLADTVGPWWLSATLTAAKLELAVDASLRSFGLLAFLGEETGVGVPNTV